MVKQINTDVLAFAGAMEGATSTEVRSPQKLGPPFTLGQFKSKDGRELRFIASGDYKSPISLPLAVPAQKVEQFDPRTKAWAAVDAVYQERQNPRHLKSSTRRGRSATLVACSVWRSSCGEYWQRSSFLLRRRRCRSTRCASV
jgi:hypothetical protein